MLKRPLGDWLPWPTGEHRLEEYRTGGGDTQHQLLAFCSTTVSTASRTASFTASLTASSTLSSTAGSNSMFTVSPTSSFTTTRSTGATGGRSFVTALATFFAT